MLRTPDSPQLELRGTTNEAVKLEARGRDSGRKYGVRTYQKWAQTLPFMTVMYPKDNTIKKCYTREKVQIDAL